MIIGTLEPCRTSAAVPLIRDIKLDVDRLLMDPKDPAHRLIPHAYDESKFPKLFEATAVRGIENYLNKNDTSHLTTFLGDVRDGSTVENRKKFIKYWAKAFNEMFFFHSLYHEDNNKYRDLIFKLPPIPLLQINGAGFGLGGIYINLKLKLDDVPGRAGRYGNSWCAWAILALLHQMVHHFFFTYGQFGFLPCTDYGQGHLRHGPNFLDSVVFLSDVLNRGFNDIFGDKVDPDLGPYTFQSMIFDQWRPSDDVGQRERFERFGIPGEVFDLFTPGGIWNDTSVWSGDHLHEAIESSFRLGKVVLPDFVPK